jgi:hypothetical protein
MAVEEVSFSGISGKGPLSKKVYSSPDLKKTDDQ